MKNFFLTALIVVFILIQSCITQEKTTIPKKITTPGDIPIAYFQNPVADKNQTKDVVQMQPEVENKNLVVQDNASTISPKTAEPKNIPVVSFQNQEPDKNQTKQVAQLQPESENKNLTEKDQTDIPPVDKEAKNTTLNKSFQSRVTNQPEQQIFNVVSGSFRIKPNAERFVNTLKNIGYPLTFMQKGDNDFYRVIVQEIFNETEARQYLQAYRENHPKYVRAWLLYDHVIDINELAFSE